MHSPLLGEVRNGEIRAGPEERSPNLFLRAHSWGSKISVSRPLAVVVDNDLNQPKEYYDSDEQPRK